MELIIIWVAIAVLTAIAANSRGRNAAVWFFVGLFFSVFGLIAVLVMQRQDGQFPARQPDTDSGRRTPNTPRTGETVKIYKGYRIERADGGVRTYGFDFPNILRAEEWIDSRENGTIPATAAAPTTRQASTRPRLLGDSSFDQFVAGTSHYQPALAAAKARHGTRKLLVTLTPTPENPHDANAVQICIDDTPVGHLPRDDAEMFHEDLEVLGREGQTLTAWGKLVGGDPTQPDISLRLDLVWPLETST